MAWSIIIWCPLCGHRSFDTIVEYYPTLNELGVTLGIWATGTFLVTVLYKIAVKVEHEVEGH